MPAVHVLSSLLSEKKDALSVERSAKEAKSSHMVVDRRRIVLL